MIRLHGAISPPRTERGAQRFHVRFTAETQSSRSLLLGGRSDAAEQRALSERPYNESLCPLWPPWSIRRLPARGLRVTVATQPHSSVTGAPDGGAERAERPTV